MTPPKNPSPALPTDLDNLTNESGGRASALALHQRGRAVNRVGDGIQTITEEGGRKTLEELVQAGVRMVTMDEVIAAAEG